MRLYVAMTLAAMITLGLTSGVMAADKKEPFASKIGMHLIGAYTDGTHKMVRARMPVLKILDVHSPMIEAARDYKRYNPDGIVVLRIFTPVRYGIETDPIETALHYWENHIWKPISALSEEDRKLIDYLEGTNEIGEVPTWESDEHIAWFTKFSIKFVELCVEHGFKPVLANIPVGNPGGDDHGVAKILQFAPALRAAKEVGGVWAYHNYTIQYTKDLEIEESYSLRYRHWYRAFTGEYADLADMPMILTEAGVDYVGNADADGWKARGSWRKYVDWLQWHDCELQKDPYIIGATLFQNGAHAAWQGWSSFDHEPLANWFVWYWNEGAKENCKD